MANQGTPEIVFITIAKDAMAHIDKKRGYKGKIEPVDVVEYYKNNIDNYKELISCATNGARYSICKATFYNHESLKKYLDEKNEERKKWIVDGILENDHFVYDEFDWKNYKEINAHRKDLGFKEVGEMINLQRGEIRRLIAANKSAEVENKILHKGLDRQAQIIKTLRSEIEKLKDRVHRAGERLKDIGKEKDEYKNKLKSIEMFLKDEEEHLLEIQNNASRGIPTVIDEYYQEHSYLGEPDKKTLSLRKLSERFGCEEGTMDISISSVDYDDIT